MPGVPEGVPAATDSVVPVGVWPSGRSRLDSRIVAVHPKKGPWGSAGYFEIADWYPDLEDPGTVGWLLHLVQEARGAVHMSLRMVPAGYYEVISYEDREGRGWDIYGIGQGPTKAQALVVALLKAP